MNRQLKLTSWWDRSLLAVLWICHLFYLLKFKLPLLSDNPYLDRDLERTAWLLKHGMVWVGPDLMQGLYCPGPFFYFFLLPVVRIFGNAPETVGALVLLLQTVSTLFVAEVLTRPLRFSRSVIYLLLSASHFLFDQVFWLNNASFVAVFIPLLFWLLWRCLEASPAKETRHSVYFGLALGLVLQIHLVFLYSIVYFVGLQYWKSRSVRKTFRHLFILGGCILLCSSIYIFAFLNDRWLHLFDGPHFHAFYSNLYAFSKATHDVSWLSFWVGSRDQIELALIVIYALLRAAWIWRKSRTQAVSAGEVVALTTGLLLVPDFALLLFNESQRYHLILFAAAIGIALFDFANLLYQIKIPHVRATTSLAVCALAIWWSQVLELPQTLYVPDKTADVKINDLNALCAYFNAQKMSFASVRDSTFELSPRFSEASVALSHYCFTEMSSASGRPTKQLVFASKNFLLDYPEHPRLKPKLLANGDFLPALALREASLTPVLETFSGILFAADYKSPHKPVTNLSSNYALDPGLPLGEQLQGFATSEFFTAGGAVKIREARFCQDPFFCSIFALTQVRQSEVRVLLVARSLEVVTPLPPIWARLEGAKLTYSCAGVRKSHALPEHIGMLVKWRDFAAVTTPLREVIHDEDCAGAEVTGLEMQHGLAVINSLDHGLEVAKSLPFHEFGEKVIELGFSN